MLSVNRKIRRLPGFRFEARAALREDVLPRMDVVLFVGFAASGPIGIPVAVESTEQFGAIFGDDLPLVWDAEKGAMVYANLASSVRSFFRNGGKRAWILRVARLEATDEKPLNRASRNFFPLAGFAAVGFDENGVQNASPAFARARAKGSWSDDFQTATALLAKSFKLTDFADADDEKIVELEIGANESINVGDLFRLRFGDRDLILTVDKLKPAAGQSPPKQISPFGKRRVRFGAKRFIWLRNLPEQILSKETHTVAVKFWTHQNDLQTVNFAPFPPTERQANLTAELPKDAEFEDSPPAVRLEKPLRVKLEFADLPASETPAEDSLLVTQIEGETVFLQVETVSSGSSQTSRTLCFCRAVGCQRKIAESGTPTQAERLTFEIWLKKDAKSLMKLSDLSFGAAHERFWGKLPTDEDLYRFADTDDRQIPAWTQIGATQNFPLVGFGGDDENFYFPVFADSLPENYLGAVQLQGTKLQRDGLESFDAELFLDPKLKNTVSANLLNEGEFIRYLSLRPRPLWGVHAALVPETAERKPFENSQTEQFYANYSLDECTIIAVPDAIHRGWRLMMDEGGILSPPVFSPPLRPEWWHFQDCRKPDVKKVSAPLWGNFLDCATRVVKPPENLRVREESTASGKFTIVWECDERDENLEFVLEESASAKFEFPTEIYRGKDAHFEISERGAGVYFYRVRARIGQDFSDWSTGLAIKIPQAENWLANSEKDYEPDVLLAVQRAILRMCAARGDLFAVLSLPEHYDENQSFNHVATLKMIKGATAPTAKVEPFSADEMSVTSFGAMYHPWLLTREDDLERFRNIPPDGAICGTFAKRSAERGAWIAPANENLQGVLGLAKEFERTRFLDFQDNLVNLVRQEPRGFTVLDSDTLSDDPDLRSINVRRLLSLLRRLALKHGAEYVFEPHDGRFRRQVERGFTGLLDVMFSRGAFAGATPATSYQVVVSETLNNLQSAEQGRFIVELRVAPSLPLKFVTVRLINAAGRSNVTEIF